MPQSTVIGLIEIEPSVQAELDSTVDVFRRDPREANSSRLDTSSHEVFQFAVAKTEIVDANLLRLAIDLENEHRRLTQLAANTAG